MPNEVGAYQAKTHLPALLERVARGEQITITKHGKPIARLVPVDGTDLERRREAVERLKGFAKGRTLGVPIKQLIEAGRR
ncbi:MAG TPA: type II toxin-antitoxin system prevent-host-death family antitoxin [Stellaceae bacterium]|nr:type II toxin-antitoxin system prevent-host-death family antitoxin [Stellaceae bacterium]